MNIDWSKAPKWAHFVAMDEDGDWYWYENLPTYWYPYEGAVESVSYVFAKYSLKERPDGL